MSEPRRLGPSRHSKDVRTSFPYARLLDDLVGLFPSDVSLSLGAQDVRDDLEAHLKRVGCDPGNTDGNWNDTSQKALDLFNKNASTSYDVKVASLDSLDGVRGKTSRVCPLVCGRGQKAEGDRCVAITCDAGMVLSDGVCKKRPDPATVRSEMKTFLSIVERHYGKRPIIYTSVDFFDDNGLSSFRGYPYWLRSVAGHPTQKYADHPFTFWQYTGTGVVPGIRGNADINVFNGNMAAWKKWLKQNAT